MSLLGLLNIQGIAGIAVGLLLGTLLLIQHGETRHWRKQSAHFEQLYASEQTALAGTIANYRAAAQQAEASDKANAERVAAEQRTINERTDHDFEARLAAARSLAQRLRGQTSATAADPGGRGSASVSGLSSPPGGPHEAAAKDRLPLAAGEIATEQAIQLDELIKWVRAQAAIDPNASR